MRGTFSLALLVLSVPGFAQDTRYVDDGGTDSGDCTTQGSPCETLSYALQQADPGDTVDVAEGTYDSTGIGGAFVGAITLQGAGSTSPRSLIRADSGDAFWFSSAQDTLAIRGFAIQGSNAAGAAVGIQAAQAATLQISDVVADLTSAASGEAGVYVEASSGSVSIQVESARFEGWHRGLDVQATRPDALDLSLSGVTITDARREGIRIQGGGASGAAGPHPDIALSLAGASTITGSADEAIDIDLGHAGALDLSLTGAILDATDYDTLDLSLDDQRGAVTLALSGNTVTAASSGDAVQVQAAVWPGATSVPGFSLQATGNALDGASAGLSVDATGFAQYDLGLSDNTLSGSSGGAAELFLDGPVDAVAPATLDLTDNELDGDVGLEFTGDRLGALDLAMTGNTVIGTGGHGGYVELSPVAGDVGATLSSNVFEGGGSNGDALRLHLAGQPTTDAFDASFALTGNTFRDASDRGLDFHAESFGVTVLDVHDNVSSGHDDDGFRLNLDGSPAAESTLELSVTGNEATGTGDDGFSVPMARFDTITATLSDNVASDNVEDGFDLGLDDAPQATLDATLAGNTASGNLEDGVTLDVTGATEVLLTLSGNTLDGTTDDEPSWRGVDLDLAPQDTTAFIDLALLDNTVTGFGDEGAAIALSRYGGGDLLVQGNALSGNAGPGLYLDATDDTLPGQLRLEVLDNTIEGVQGTTPRAAWFRFGDGNAVQGTLRGNTVSLGDEAGLEVLFHGETNSADLAITGNTVTANGDGIRVGATDSYYNDLALDIGSNTIAGNDRDGLVLGLEGDETNFLDARVHRNLIDGNGGDGIEVYIDSGALDASIAGNLIQNQAGHGIHIAQSDPWAWDLDLRHNTFAGNADGYSSTEHFDLDFGYDDAENGWLGSDQTSFRSDVSAPGNWFSTEAPLAGRVYDNPDDQGTLDHQPWPFSLDIELAATTGPEAGGTPLVIHAVGDSLFVGDVPDHPLEVTVGGQAAGDVQVIDGGRSILCTLPAHDPGLVDVTVTNPGGQSATLSDGFEYLADFVDEDDDGVEDAQDTCPDTPNPEQTDTDDDGQGDACDPDDDDDGLADDQDNCPTVPNPDQLDADGDGIGDACDLEVDSDGDGMADPQDNCPNVANPDQADQDGDGIGDACDLDADGDGTLDAEAGCGCTSAPTPAGGLWAVGLLGLLGLRRRR